ncbi:MAG: hypothetical protein ACLQVD_00485 [Capsulimonadaceae bacterium]
MPQPKRYGSNAQRQSAYRLRKRKQSPLPGAFVARPTISSMPASARWRQMTAQALALLQTIEQEMQQYYDQRSERWQEGDKGAEFQERLDAVTQACEAVDELLG